MNKGFVESGVIAALVIILGAVGSTGILFAGGNVASSGFIATTSLLTAYSQMPHVKRDFRERKANEKCGFNCSSIMTDDDLLAFIRDDEASYMGNGGNFINGYMN